MAAIGRAYGLAWTPEGSSLIQVKARIRKGTGKITILGDVGHEFLLSLENVINLFCVTQDFNLEYFNITIDAPGPIDGPSASLAMFICLYSAVTRQPINQRIAFTGALSDTGVVLAVGGIVDKIVAARRAGLEAIVMPIENMSDLPAYADACPWGNLVISPILRVAEAVVLSLPK